MRAIIDSSTGELGVLLNEEEARAFVDFLMERTVWSKCDRVNGLNIPMAVHDALRPSASHVDSEDIARPEAPVETLEVKWA